MSSKASSNGRRQIDPPYSHRTSSFSSLSSLSSNSSNSFHDDSPLFSPRTPLHPSKIPFSWEKLPGIPKRQLSKKKDSFRSNMDLPLPPAGNQFSYKKLDSCGESFRKDPFFAALVECSKDNSDHDDPIGKFWKGSKITRALSDSFGFMSIYASCKRTCAVSDSMIYVPTSRNT